MFEENEKKKKNNEADAAYLISAADNIEADRLTAALNDAHIPVIKKYEGIGSYMTIIAGNSRFGVNLYVPTELLENAKEIIAVVNGNIVSQIDENEINDDTAQADEAEYEEVSKSSKKINTFFGVYYLSDLIIYGLCGIIVVFCVVNLIFKFI